MTSFAPEEPFFEGGGGGEGGKRGKIGVPRVYPIRAAYCRTQTWVSLCGSQYGPSSRKRAPPVSNRLGLTF